MTIQDIIKEGYQSLATRTLKSIDDAQKIHPRTPIFQDVLKKYKHHLSQLSKKGNIETYQKQARDDALDMGTIIQEALPRFIQPDTYQMAKDWATAAVQTHFNFTDLEELLKKANISHIEQTFQTPQLSIYEEDGQTKKTLLLSFDPRIPAISFIVNIHEFYHALQPEFYRAMALINHCIDSIPKLADCTLELQRNQGRLEKIQKTIISTHLLHIYQYPDFLAFAQDYGVDIHLLTARIDKEIPELDFLTSYIEGDAYLTQTDILNSSPHVRCNPQVHILYNFLSLLDSLLVPFSHTKRVANTVGVGIAEYIRQHPELKEVLTTSKQVHKELSKTYFPITQP